MGLKKYFKESARFKSITGAIILAFFLWLYVALNRTVTDDISCRLIPVNIIPGKTLTVDLPEHVNVSVTGQGIDLLLLHLFWRSEITFDLDMRSIRRYYVFNIKDERYLDRISMPREFRDAVSINGIISPDTISIRLEDIAVRRLPVGAGNITLELRDGYTLVGGLKFDPDSIEVSGPESSVDELTEIMTVEKVYQNKRSDFSEMINVLSIPTITLDLSENEVEVFADIQKIGEKNIAAVPINVVGNPGSRQVEILPSTLNIIIKGGVDHIKDLSVDDIYAYVNYDRSWRRDGEYIARVNIELPDYIISYEVSPQDFKVIVK
ncbi:YbbR-like domain-containing protein [candidate division KSB1 bacterium]